MILILDNNQFRRKDLFKALHKKGYVVACHPFDEYKLYTKPLMTVLMNPARSEIDKVIEYSSTKYVVAKDFFKSNGDKYTLIPLTPNPVDYIIEEYHKIEGCHRNQMDVYGIACHMYDEYAIGGKMLEFYEMEAKIFEFFLKLPNKKFMDFDVSRSFPFRVDPEENFKQAVWKINMKTKDATGIRYILSKNGCYFLNPLVYRLEPKFVDFIDDHEIFKN